MFSNRDKTMNDDNRLVAALGLALFGTVVGLILEYATKLPERNWTQVCANAVLNGVFTAGVFLAAQYFTPSVTPVVAAGVAAVASSFGRNLIIRLAHKWAGK